MNSSLKRGESTVDFSLFDDVLLLISAMVTYRFFVAQKTVLTLNGG
jgi:hypothetical protein